jgi:hypothetical protein
MDRAARNTLHSTTDNYKQITRRNTPHKRKASPKHMAA